VGITIAFPKLTRLMLPKLFSTETQFLERQSIASHIALLDKQKVVIKTKKYIFLFIIEYSFTKTSIYFS
jgi:hypothetical protein